ncbi:hypothetical protein OUZ56_032709 [Daphnia magna]|uniref:Uncharacterized protein n=1 Tax=Daphnia magna TaxID=35525 RepID=A0ABQ9ZWW5_9CRUS|nr:hypothetical protein OUZ56_032709 [Daphnia magna]
MSFQPDSIQYLTDNNFINFVYCNDPPTKSKFKRPVLNDNPHCNVFHRDNESKRPSPSPPALVHSATSAEIRHRQSTGGLHCNLDIHHQLLSLPDGLRWSEGDEREMISDLQVMGPGLQLCYLFDYLWMAAAGQPTQEIRQIAKLNGKNWSSWRYGVNLLLEKNRLNRVVSRQELLPPQSVANVGLWTDESDYS